MKNAPKKAQQTEKTSPTTKPKKTAAAKQPPAKKIPAAKPPPAKKTTAAKQPAAKKTAAAAKPTAPKKTAAAKPTAAEKTAAAKPMAAKKFGPRADLGAPIDNFFGKQPPHLRAILEELRKLVEAAAPDAEASLKWGMPFYTLGGAMMCALGGHKSHVNLILSGPPGAFADPEGRLTGEGKTGRHLKLTALDQLPRDAVRGWLRAAVKLARNK